MKPLTEKEQAKYLEEAKKRFINGGCAVLAYEMGKHLPTSCQLVYTTTGGTHAFLVSDCGNWAVDINGVVDIEEMLDEWNSPSELYESIRKSIYGINIIDEENEYEFGIFPNDEKGRAEFAEATDWFFETVGENLDRQLWYWGELLAEYVKYKTIQSILFSLHK